MKTLENVLKKHFDYSTFRTGQKEIIEDVLVGKDVLGVLPTGSGKSICYQLPAKILDGIVVVVSPLISLMIDQVKQLRANGFKEVVAINSFLNFSTRNNALVNLSKYKLVYLSPEMLQNSNLVDKLAQLKVSLFVVDEAHCISQWGHEFRPDYLKMAKVVQRLGNPNILALSATATPEVQEDIINQLNTKKMVRHIYSMDRDNIAFSVEHFDHSDQKVDYLVQLLKNYPVPTMIYFSSRNWTEKVSELLSRKLPELRIAFYHGGMEQADRILIQQQFMNNQLDVICCTSAFGMGINKSNIRLVVHFHLPTQLESFIQEVGRAGRDGNSSVSLVLIAPNDDLLPKMLIESELPASSMIQSIIDFLVEQRDVALKDTAIMEQFHLNETQWRFLHYQLEKHGMIVNNRMKIEHNEKTIIKNKIYDLITTRKIYKQKKLAELFNWATTDSCRRVKLFSTFQENVGKAKFYCCDVCDFQFSKWNPSLAQTNDFSTNWEEQLKFVMLQGD